MRAANGGWCAPKESIYTVILGEDYTGDFLMRTQHSCMSCEVEGVEHPLTPLCADTVARDWIEHDARQ